MGYRTTYKRLSKLLVKEIVRFSVTCLNQLPAEDGVSDTLSPNAILTGKADPDYNNMRVEFGSYVQIYEPATFATNTLRSRTTGAIALTATGNTQGDYYFLSLITGRRVSRHQWTQVPVTEAAIERVEQLATKETQSWVQTTGLLVEWRPENPFEDDYDPDYMYNEEADDDYIDDLEWDEPLSDEDTIASDHPLDIDTINNPDIEDVNTTYDGTEDTSLFFNDVESNVMLEETKNDLDNTLDLVDDMTQATHNEDIVNDRTVEPEVNRYNLRPSRQRSYEHRLDHIMDEHTTSKSYETPVQLAQHST
jgi:hypothetical protein